MDSMHPSDKRHQPWGPITIDNRSRSGAGKFLSNGFVFDYVGLRE